MRKDNLFDYVAHLARLGPYEAKDKERLSQDFNRILDLFKALEELNTQSVNPMSHILDLKNVAREDETQVFKNREKTLGNFPQKEGNFLKVPKVIE